MTPVTMYVSQIHLGKDLGAFGRHQESLQSLLEKMCLMSAWDTKHNQFFSSEIQNAFKCM